jgi:very-short-patch-repair endonuclease
MKNIGNYSTSIIHFSKHNSRNMSLPEKILWFEILQKRQLGGLKFIKQKIIQNYIVDFYCSELKLIIELDGNSHDSIFDKDKLRDKDLENLGYIVVRVNNSDVLNNLEGVLAYLKIKVNDICS